MTESHSRRATWAGVITMTIVALIVMTPGNYPVIAVLLAFFVITHTDSLIVKRICCAVGVIALLTLIYLVVLTARADAWPGPAAPTLTPLTPTTLRLTWQPLAVPPGPRATGVRRYETLTGPPGGPYTTTIVPAGQTTLTLRDLPRRRAWTATVRAILEPDGASTDWQAAPTVRTSAQLTGPAPGQRLSLSQRTPGLVWTPIRGVDYYNVQLLRHGRKILTAWPVEAHLLLPAAWRYHGRAYRLRPGRYRWYAWTDRGRRIGTRTFEVTP
jgi:hypothetical protein